MKNSELCVNIWFIVDIATGICYGWCGRVYHLQGSDAEKTTILNQLAETDFNTVERESFPKQWITMMGSQKLEGQFPVAQANDILRREMDYFSRILESRLPKLYSFNGRPEPNGNTLTQKIPDNPLYVSTILMENEKGEMRPYTRAENKNWVNEERKRIDNLKRN